MISLYPLSAFLYKLSPKGIDVKFSDIISTNEAIAYQRNDSFGPELESLVTEFVELVKQDTPSKFIEGNKDLKDRFNKLVLGRTGINAYLITDKALAATMPNVYNPNTILGNEELNDALNGDYHSLWGSGLLYNKQSGFKVGTVDLKKAKLGGWFCEQPVPVFANFIDLVKQHELTPPEITAVILHELGHDFEGAAMCTRVNTSNQVVADAVKNINGVPEDQRMEYVYRELSKVSPQLSKEDVDGLGSSNPVVMGVSSFRAIVEITRSLSDSEHHDRTTYEALSDSFAVRFGYGQYLASGLDKMLNDPGRKVIALGASVFKAALVLMLILEIIKLIRAFWSLKGTSEALLKISISILISIMQRVIAAVVLTNTERESTRDMTYDLDKDRFIRVRNDLVNSLKDDAIDTKTRKSTLEQIKFVDTVINRSTNLRGILGGLSILLSPTDRNVYKAIKTQQEVEKMIANDIFVSASKLKTQ